jgi:hypothetical protein
MASRNATRILLAALAVLVLHGTSGADEPLSAEARSRRILELEQALATAHDRLADLISEAPTEGAPPLRESPELVEIASQLAAWNSELRALRLEAARMPEVIPR